MKNFINIGLIASLFTTGVYAKEVSEKRDRIKSVKEAVGTFATTDKKDISIVDNLKRMFIDGKVSGQIRSLYAGYNQKEQNSVDSYATALGGKLKYELAEYNGFNAGIAFLTSHDIDSLTGERSEGKNNSELSSSSGDYTELSEAYINYRYKDLNLRAGRQVVDTPLADSDDIRMIQNTFEAYIATYSLLDFNLMLGNLDSWQGVDTGLDDGRIKTAQDGTWFGGVSYGDKIEFNAWYYNITKITNAIYIDIGVNYDINKDISIYSAIQYLNESELDNSGYEADIYGGVVEFVAYDIGFNLAYNSSKKHSNKNSFSGTGGGAIFTSMDTMIIDEITQDRDVEAIVAGISYDIQNWRMLYAYGDFRGDKNTIGQKAHILEQDIGFEYELKKELFVAAIYVVQEDKESMTKSQYDWNRLQLMVAYNF
jgi:predicted porin